MRILITSAASQLSLGLAATLSAEHAIRTTDRVQINDAAEFVKSDLGHDFSTNLLVREMKAIIHVAEPLPEDTDEQQVDYLTRATYNLLFAAAEEGVERVVYLSKLSLMSSYDQRYLVTERWRPRPTTAVSQLSTYLGEAVCKEFARERRLKVVVLRLGQVAKAAEGAGKAGSDTWLDERDLSQAVGQALTADIPPWSVFHIQSDLAQARFSITTAQQVLGYKPTMEFK